MIKSKVIKTVSAIALAGLIGLGGVTNVQAVTTCCDNMNLTTQYQDAWLQGKKASHGSCSYIKWYKMYEKICTNCGAVHSTSSVFSHESGHDLNCPDN